MKLINQVRSIFLSLILIAVLGCKEESSSEPKTDLTSSTGHPSLILTEQGVKDIRANLGSIPIFDETLGAAQEELDAEIEKSFDVPIPEDYSGGYTHEIHKKNYILMQKAGVLYQILDEEKYAKFVKDMLLEYARLYPTLPIHPKPRSYARGKLFWQCLNDSNWLVYTSQAYDCIYDYLSKEERNNLETNLFKPYADFISKENPLFFNRVHNHSTWGNVAVGMIALVMEDDSLLQTALYGLKDVSISKDQKDNDGGFINTDDKKIGFFANLDEPFSPDGYYTEGPYYQRYAMYPFLIFAQALQNKKPTLNVFDYKEGVLIKGVNALLNLSDSDGDFFLLNDSQKGMSYYTTSLVSAVDIAYHFGGNDPELLSIAEKQGEVTLDDAGLAVALGIKQGKSKPFIKKSIELSDGANGDEGAVGILRSDGLELVFKYTAHGLSHGHYDKLSFALFQDGVEVVQDYGMARFVNIEQKGGGNYLKENNSWAKQTIAHNTIVQNEGSHFQGSYDIGSKHHSEKYIFSVDNDNLHVASAKDQNAYPGTELHRTMVMIKDTEYENPYVLDIIKVNSETENQYDFPLYFMGHVMKVNFEYESSTPEILGKDSGYQHLYVEGRGKPSGESTTLSWLGNGNFYTLTTATDTSDELIFTHLGANDPDFNLRRDAGFIIRRKNSQNTVFASIIEPHGNYSPVSELAVNSNSRISNIKVVLDTEEYTAVSIEDKTGNKKLFILCNTDASKTKEHQVKINDRNYKWTGPYYFYKE